MKQQSKTEALDERVSDLAARCKLEGWNAFVEEIGVPADLYPALITGRPELLRLALPRALNVEETGKLYKLLAALIETNMALREHAEQLAQLVDAWDQQFVGLRSVGEKIHRFANFQRSAEETDGDVS